MELVTGFSKKKAELISKLIGYLGSLLIVLGLVILLLIFSPVLVQEVEYQVKKTSFQEYKLIENSIEAEEVKKETSIVYRRKLLIPKSFAFSLVIPKIGVNVEAFPNVDSANQEEYLPILNKGVAHVQGSSLPDQPGVVFIFAHSTDSFYNIARYNAFFFLLRKLEAGDEVYLFYKNKKYHYRTIEKKIVDSEGVGEVVKGLKGNYLVLQTCYPPGTTLRRLLAIAKLVN